MIFDTSVILAILKDKSFLKKLPLEEEVKITSITAYELLRGAIYIKFARERERELNIVLDLISKLRVLPFDEKSSRIASYIWGKLKSSGKIVNDADIMIAAISVANAERLITLDSGFEVIKGIYPKLDVRVIE